MPEEPDRNCTQVALECGFSSSAQFSTMFREKYGITPKKYALEKKDPARSAEETP
jgi:bacterial regulatory helix-turn-helix proteins, araC family